ncbi:hypothetical protein HWV62_27133 [Athelia sp. TMB]|nr:hypothetical protein HWV62_40412 [Athelia sp. TMB]KAF7982669.1 hypothetical protein HWV62_27133 [Athelia sp. TMB]
MQFRLRPGLLSSTRRVRFSFPATENVAGTRERGDAVPVRFRFAERQEHRSLAFAETQRTLFGSGEIGRGAGPKPKRVCALTSTTFSANLFEKVIAQNSSEESVPRTTSASRATTSPAPRNFVTAATNRSTHAESQLEDTREAKRSRSHAPPDVDTELVESWVVILRQLKRSKPIARTQLTRMSEILSSLESDAIHKDILQVRSPAARTPVD